MRNFFEHVQPIVKQETKFIFFGTSLCVVLMWIMFFALHKTMPQNVPFDYRIILGGLLGDFVAVLNFFLMGVTVQKISDTENQELAFTFMKTSYRQRTLIQILWIIAAMVIPWFHYVAGIVPLLFPGMVIKFRGMIKKEA